MTYGIEMLLFTSLPYIIGELIILVSLVSWFECYLSAKLRLEIKDKKTRINVIGWTTIGLLLADKFLFIIWNGM